MSVFQNETNQKNKDIACLGAVNILSIQILTSKDYNKNKYFTLNIW